jgi:adenylate cyclase
MMAVFGAPEALAKKEQAAVEAGRRIVDSMPEGLAVGVGIATGPAFVGSIRSTDRLIWSAVGSTTNLASRLQALTREFGASLALDATTRERAGYVCADFAAEPGRAALAVHVVEDARGRVRARCWS